MELKKVYFKHFPFKNYIALTFYPWAFIRKELRSAYTSKVERHETTHALQQIETLWIGFFILYGLEYIIKLILCNFKHEKAYYSISFEQEAYNYEKEFFYNETRKHYNWIKYVFKLK